MSNLATLLVKKDFGCHGKTKVGLFTFYPFASSPLALKGAFTHPVVHVFSLLRYVLEVLTFLYLYERTYEILKCNVLQKTHA